jgi:hypothetical protein
MVIKLDGALAQVVDAIADRFADRLLARIGTVPRNGAAGRTTTNGRRSSKLAGRKLDMRCRYPGCKNKSKGPRFSFLCEQHLKLPKKQREVALEKWKASHASA